MVAPFTGLNSIASFPVTRKLDNDVTSVASNGGKVQCMQVWPPINMKKFERLSYLPPLTTESLAKEVDYLILMGWIPCLEFELEFLLILLNGVRESDCTFGVKLMYVNFVGLWHGFVYREHNSSPGYYDGWYWTMWKLPLFGCTDSSQVVKELLECIKEYPKANVRIIGFNSLRQVQCVSFTAHQPEA